MCGSLRSIAIFREAKDFEAVLGELSADDDARLATLRK